jgi:hypothetical protein
VKDAGQGAGLIQDNSEIVAELIRAIELSESGKEKPGEGIMTEAKDLAQQWKNEKNRPLFASYTENNRIMLLVGLVVALRRDHEILKSIRKRFPNELEKLSISASRAEFDDVWAVASKFVLPWLRAKPRRTRGESRLLEAYGQLTPKQKYERNRRLPKGEGLILRQFVLGRALVASLQGIDTSNPAGRSRMDVLAAFGAYLAAPTCLDGIFAGKPVNMVKLQELFGIERHRLTRLAGVNGNNTSYDYRLVAKIMDRLLREKPAKKRKRTGRPPREPRLNPLLRTYLLTGIEERINSISSVPEHIKTEFLAVVHRHRNLPDSGK